MVKRFCCQLMWYQKEKWEYSLWLKAVVLNELLTENWLARIGVSSHFLGNNWKRWNSPLKLLPILPALQIDVSMTKVIQTCKTQTYAETMKSKLQRCSISIQHPSMEINLHLLQQSSHCTLHEMIFIATQIFKVCFR